LRIIPNSIKSIIMHKEEILEIQKANYTQTPSLTTLPDAPVSSIDTNFSLTFKDIVTNSVTFYYNSLSLIFNLLMPNLLNIFSFYFIGWYKSTIYTGSFG